MSCRTIIPILIIILILTTSGISAQKQSAQSVPFEHSNIMTLRQSPGLATADSCIISNVDSLAWLVTGWIIGDELYGVRSKRLLLHAEKISFKHPVTGEIIEVKSKVPF